MRLQHVLIVDIASTEYLATRKHLYRRNFDSNLEIRCEIFPDSRTDGPCTFQNNEAARLRDLEIENLSRRRIGGVCDPCEKELHTKRAKYIPMTENVAPALRTAITATTRSTLR
jgi:hypothetical protein